MDWAAAQPKLSAHLATFNEAIEQGLSEQRWGDLPQWQTALQNLPKVQNYHFDLSGSVTIGDATNIDATQKQQLRDELMALHPWRKGPIDLFGIHIDTEWRSDWKWDRVLPHIENLQDRVILDVGCGNGYHCLRMLGQGAKRVVGIDPSVKFVHQFYALKNYLPQLPVDVLPLGIEKMPKAKLFDTVFSMGVLYHRRNPSEHLNELKNLTRTGGQIVLETLIIDAEDGAELIPNSRYAKMRNVWSIPAPGTVINWMREIGLKNPKLVDSCITSLEEQRSTDWMRFESLKDFLDPDDQTLTVEGHPAPVRAVFVAEA